VRRTATGPPQCTATGPPRCRGSVAACRSTGRRARAPALGLYYPLSRLSKAVGSGRLPTHVENVQYTVLNVKNVSRGTARKRMWVSRKRKGGRQES
jgi:hypothetical protein